MYKLRKNGLNDIEGIFLAMISKKFSVTHHSFKNKLIFVLYISLSTILLFLVLIFFLRFLPFNNKIDIVNISNNWQLYTDSNSKSIHITNVKSLGNNKANETIYLSKTLEKIDNLDTLFIKSLHQHICVYLDEIKLFESSLAGEYRDPGIELYFIQLPKEYDKKTLRLEITSPYKYYMETAYPIYIGTITSIYAFIFSEAFPNLFYLFTCLITGIFLIIYFTYLYINGVNKLDKLCLGLFSIFWGLYCISWDNIACLVFSPVAVYRISALLHIVYLLPLFIYFRLNFTLCQKFTFILQSLFCCIIVIVCVLLFLSVIDFPNTVLVYNYILDAIFLPMIVVACFEFKHGNPLIHFLAPTILLIIIGVIGTILEQYTLIKGIFFYLASIFIFICFNWVYNLKEILNWRTEEKKKLKTLELKSELVLNRYNEMQSYMEKIYKIKHEINHHISAIQALCKEGNIDRIEKYISTLSSNILFTKDISYSNNPIVDCILSSYTAQAEKLDIQFKYFINIPKYLPLPDTDICSLLLNILDNAIEASQLSDNKWIQFKIILKENFLVIVCKNSYNGVILKQDGEFITQKFEKKEHGYGIPIIKSILKKYGDMLIISYDSNQFRLKAILQL